MKLTKELQDGLGILMRAYPYDLRDFGIISHPLISHNVTFLGEGSAAIPVLINETNWDKTLEERIAWMNSLDTIEAVFYVALNKPYKLDILNYISHKLDVQTYSKLLGELWTEVEFPHQSGVRNLVRMFKRANPEYLMDKEDYEVFLKLQEEPDLVLYRGIAGEKALARGLSWTTKREKAVWFAKRFDHGTGKIIRAYCLPDYRFAYFGGRAESEVVLNPYGLEIISEEKES